MENKLYKTETHRHCGETSGCSLVTGDECVRRYKEEGFSTIFVSDHYNRKWFCDCETREDYDIAVEKQLRGYRTAKAEGDRIGLQVLLSCELNIDGNDYLFYGIDEEFFYDKSIGYMTPHELFAFCNERGYTLIAAHPFREDRVPVPEAVHGIEIVNGGHNHYYHNNNDKARALAESLPNHLRTSGSDAHFLEDIAHGGIISEEPILSSEDYIRVLRRGNYSIIDVPTAKEDINYY